MRKLAVAILAVPVIASIYLATLLALPGARRYLSGVAAALLVGVVGIGFVLTHGSASNPASVPLADSAARPAPIDSGLGAIGTTATSAPRTPSVTTPVIGPGIATGSSGMGSPTGPAPSIPPKGAVAGSSSLLDVMPVRAATTARITGSASSGSRVRLTSAIQLRFDRAVTLRAVRAALTITPSVVGTVKADSSRLYTFIPASPLAPNTSYTVRLTATMRDRGGVAIAAPRPVRILTAAAPAIVRFRPVKGADNVDPTAPISVRFTLPMDRSTTARALEVVIAGRNVDGTISWAEHDTVLVFKPATANARGSGVGVRILATATSTDGVPLKAGRSTTFRVVAAPTSKPKADQPTPKPIQHPSPPKPSGPAARIAGIDVSHHQGPIDWAQVAAAGITFAYVKASEGTSYVDPMYAANRAGAEQAGLRIGAFHYAEPDPSAGEAAAEADHFIATAAFRSGELLPMLDLEVTNGLSPMELQNWVAAFLDRIYQRTGLHAGIYVSPTFWETDLSDTTVLALAGYDALWIAHWTPAPAPRVPASNWGGHGWTIWQYSHNGTVAGIGRPTDLDHFGGSDLASLFIH